MNTIIALLSDRRLADPTRSWRPDLNAIAAFSLIAVLAAL
jgi:hypothetical protein